MIAAGIGNDAALPFRRIQLRDRVVGAAQLKAADGLQALRLQIRYRVCDRGDPDQRRVQNRIAKPFPGFGKLDRGDKLGLRFSLRDGHDQISRMMGMMKGRLDVCLWM